MSLLMCLLLEDGLHGGYRYLQKTDGDTVMGYEGQIPSYEPEQFIPVPVRKGLFRSVNLLKRNYRCNIGEVCPNLVFVSPVGEASMYGRKVGHRLKSTPTNGPILSWWSPIRVLTEVDVP